MCTALGPQANSGSPKIKITWFWVVNWRRAGPTSNQTMAANSRWKQQTVNKQMQTSKQNKQTVNEGWKDGRKDGRMEKWKDGRMEGKTEGWKTGSTSSQPCAPEGPADIDNL